LAVTPENAPAIAQICDLLDGIPLAIELAAARLNCLSAQQIARRLSDRFRLLTTSPRTSVSRHRTLLAAVEWSYDLLPDHEKRLSERTSVFSGTFDLDAAESVCSGDPIQTRDVLDLLTRLAEKSLIVTDNGSGAPAVRYRLLKTLCAFGHIKLMERGEEKFMRKNHPGILSRACGKRGVRSHGTQSGGGP
jgi:predicted ATPase